MPKIPVLKAKELIKILNSLGFFKFHQVGSHAQFKHPDGRRVTIPIHFNKDIGRKTLMGILKDIDVEIKDIAKLKRKDKKNI